MEEQISVDEVYAMQTAEAERLERMQQAVEEAEPGWTQVEYEAYMNTPLTPQEEMIVELSMRVEDLKTAKGAKSAKGKEGMEAEIGLDIESMPEELVWVSEQEITRLREMEKHVAAVWVVKPGEIAQRSRVEFTGVRVQDTLGWWTIHCEKFWMSENKRWISRRGEGAQAKFGTMDEAVAFAREALKSLLGY